MFLWLQRVHFDIQVGEHAIDYANVAQKEKLTELQLRVRQLIDQVDQIAKEQNYQRVSLWWYDINTKKNVLFSSAVHNILEYLK